MKKIFLMFLITLSLFSVTNVSAASKNIELVGIDIVDKSNTISVDEPVISSNEITSSIKFNELNDYVDYKLTLKNNENERLKIESINDNLENENIEILYTFDSSNYINSNDTTIVNVKMVYKNQLINVDKIEINDLKIILNLVSEEGNSSSSDFMINPATGDSIIYYILLFSASLIVLFIILKKKTKRLKVVGLLLIFGLISIPLFSYALARYEVFINYKALIIKGEFRYTVSFDTAGGSSIDNQIVTQGKKVTRPSDPTKLNYKFVNWYTDENYNTIFDFDNVLVDGPLTIYAKWDSFPTLFSHPGSCTFNGHNNVITGDNCEYAGQYYIDTNIPLYSSDNYGLDYEFGFTIDNYSSADNIKQATFVNTKYENESVGWPGLVVRRVDLKNFLEVTETIHGTKVNAQFTPSVPLTVRVYRIGGIIYYSLDGKLLVQLQNINNTSDYFNTTTWFGASQALDGSPQRELKGVLSNMYVKLGKYNISKTVTFDPNGGVVGDASRVIEGVNPIGELPVPEFDNLVFLGWYTEPDGGTLVSSSSIVSDDITLYAHWDLRGAAKMNGEFYSSVQSAIDVAPDGATITVLKDVGEFLTVDSSKNIILDLNGHTLKNKNSSSYAVIENNGKLEVKNGTLTSDVKVAVINNNDGASLIVNNALVEATGLRQGIYNYSGTVTITGSSIIRASSSERAALHNKAGKTTIISGVIESSNFSAIVVDAGALIVGEKDDLYDNSSIVIKGEKYGISTSVNISVYDGIIKGIVSSINNQAKITSIEDDSTIVNDDEIVDGKNYKILYYVIN